MSPNSIRYSKAGFVAGQHPKVHPARLHLQASWCAVARAVLLLASIAVLVVMASLACKQLRSASGPFHGQQPVTHRDARLLPGSVHPIGSLHAPDTPSCRSLGASIPMSAYGPEQLPAQRILVTGAAGFIGFHVAKSLTEQVHGGTGRRHQHAVVGLDSFTAVPGFGASLKRDRAEMLWRCCQVHVVQGDIGNTTLLQQLFGCFNFTQVLHLAGRAGVRQSRQQPEAYVSTNVLGSVQLLQVMAQQPSRPSLVYASSSSVYGSASSASHLAAAAAAAVNPVHQPSGWAQGWPDAGTAVPSAAKLKQQQQQQQQQQQGQQEQQQGQQQAGLQPLMPSQESDSYHPLSVYAASKVALEQLVGVYSQQYNMTATGLRFFTVYGPWGRPDMAVLSLAHSLMHHRPINITCFSALDAKALKQVQAVPAPQQHTAEAAAQQHREPPAGAVAAAPSLSGPGHLRSSSMLPSGCNDVEAEGQQYGAPPGCIPACRDFTHIDDVVAGTLAACRAVAAAASASKQPSHHVYNIGRGEPHSVLTVLRALEGFTGNKAAAVRFSSVPSGNSPDAQVTWADTAAAEAGLGFRARIELRQGLKGVVEWLQEYESHLATV